MQTATQHSRLSFDQAINLALDLLPGLRHDFQVIADLRKKTPRDMEGVGRYGLKIPDPVMPIIREYFPDCFQEDTDLQGKAWLKFMNRPEAERFKVQRKL